MRIRPAASAATALALAGGVLAGCAQPWPEPPVPSRTAVQPEPVYCYISLADRACYARPVPGQRYRLAGTRPTEPR